MLVRAPNWVGDVVLSLPALRDLRRAFPASRLEVLARPWVAGLYAAVPEIDGIVESRGALADAAAIRGRYDLGLLLPNSFASAFTLWRAGIPERWGYATDARGALLTRSCRVSASVGGRSQVYYYRAMLEGLGLAVSGPPDASLACPEAWAERGRALLGSPGPWIGINPGAAYGTAKRWPPGRFAAARRSWRAAAARRSRSSALRRRAARSPRRSRRSSAVPRACCAARRRSPTSSACCASRDCCSPTTRVPCTPPPRSARRSSLSSARPTGPRRRRSGARVVREETECAPCKLRECPIDHRCMARVAVDRVAATALELLVA
jgi:heptosyltransferase-2